MTMVGYDVLYLPDRDNKASSAEIIRLSGRTTRMEVQILIF